MARVDIAVRVEALLEKLPEFLRCVEADVRPEAKDEWSADYAIFVVDVMEPDDGVREYFDVGTLFNDMHAYFAKGLSKKAVRLNNCDVKDPEPGTLLVRKHSLGGGWSREFEIYRTKAKSAVTRDALITAIKDGVVKKERKPSGFTLMTPDQHKEAASKGGKVAHQLGRAHELKGEKAKAAGKKGGLARAENARKKRISEAKAAEANLDRSLVETAKTALRGLNDVERKILLARFADDPAMQLAYDELWRGGP